MCIWCRDSNSQPREHESYRVTTRQQLINFICLHSAKRLHCSGNILKSVNVYDSNFQIKFSRWIHRWMDGSIDRLMCAAPLNKNWNQNFERGEETNRVEHKRRRRARQVQISLDTFWIGDAYAAAAASAVVVVRRDANVDIDDDGTENDGGGGDFDVERGRWGDAHIEWCFLKRERRRFKKVWTGVGDAAAWYQFTLTRRD